MLLGATIMPLCQGKCDAFIYGLLWRLSERVVRWCLDKDLPLVIVKKFSQKLFTFKKRNLSFLRRAKIETKLWNDKICSENKIWISEKNLFRRILLTLLGGKNEKKFFLWGNSQIKETRRLILQTPFFENIFSWKC